MHRDSVQVDLSLGKPLLPEEPGVYIFKDKDGQILYIGKAKNLRKRVSSYFSKTPMSSKISSMLNRAKFLEFIVTSNEKEALLLESNLIKNNLPRYNVVLRDDKRYPVIRIDLSEKYPRLSIVRKIERDGALYFGPFHSAASLRSTLRLINRLFKLRTCKNMPKDKRPCLNYQIGRCLAPCRGDVSEEEYMKSVENARLFLEGKGKKLIERLKQEMFSAAERLEFEKAARIRDQISAIKKVLEKQQMISTTPENTDIVGIYQEDSLSQVVVLVIRDGFLIRSKNFLFKEDEDVSYILGEFLKQYYLDCQDIPDSIIIPFEIEDLSLIASMISDYHRRTVKIQCASDPRKIELVNMANRNAKELLKSTKKEADILEQIKELFSLKRLPLRIEAVDISQLRGKQPVGSIVAFKDGKPEKRRYMNFRIRGKYKDDFSMMQEVIKRRIKKGNLPDLFLIDGGKAHLSAVAQVIDEEVLEDKPDLIAIAKGGEKADKIYLRDKNEPVSLPDYHPVLLFLMKIRDEAHRRAISYHRKLREKEEITTILYSIPGIGKKKAEILLKSFKDIEEIISAPEERIAMIPGIGPKLAKKIKEYLINETA